MNDHDVSIRLNVERGLCSLVDQAVARLARQLPSVSHACLGLGDVVKQAIREHPSIPSEDMTALDLARRVGLVKPNRKRRGRR